MILRDLNLNKIHRVNAEFCMYRNKPENTKSCSSTIDVVVVKNLNSASRINWYKTLHVLLDTWNEEKNYKIDKTWIKLGEESNLVKTNIWVTGAGAIIIIRYILLVFEYWLWYYSIR